VSHSFHGNRFPLTTQARTDSPIPTPSQTTAQGQVSLPSVIARRVTTLNHTASLRLHSPESFRLLIRICRHTFIPLVALVIIGPSTDSHPATPVFVIMSPMQNSRRDAGGCGHHVHLRKARDIREWIRNQKKVLRIFIKVDVAPT
jgi:hypothetical protein